jgi:hypothetical protein
VRPTLRFCIVGENSIEQLRYSSTRRAGREWLTKGWNSIRCVGSVEDHYEAAIAIPAKCTGSTARSVTWLFEVSLASAANAGTEATLPTCSAGFRETPDVPPAVAVIAFIEWNSFLKSPVL